jgi:hypothetical protein
MNTLNDITLSAANGNGNSGNRFFVRRHIVNHNWVVIHRDGRLSPTVGGQTRCRVVQITRREFDALPRKRRAALVAEEYRRGAALIRDSELVVTRIIKEHFKAIGGA